MRLVISFLVFLVCNGSVGALVGQNKNSKVLAEETQEMMNKVNKMNNFLKDFCNGLNGMTQDTRLKDTQNVRNDEIKKTFDTVNPKPYNEPGKNPSNDIKARSYNEQGKGSADSINSLEAANHHGERIQLFYKLQDRYQDLQSRFTNLKKQGQEVKELQEQWVNSKYDKGIYAQYAEEKSKYDEALKSYNKDLAEHSEMKRQHDAMKKLVVAEAN